MPQSCDMGPTALLRLRRMARWGFFFRPKNPAASAGFEPANLGTTDQRANHRSRLNGELTVISLTGENEDEKKEWNRKRWVLIIEMFMYFGNAYILSRWNNCILHLVTQTYYIRVKNNQMNESLSKFFLRKHVLAHWLLAWKCWTDTAGWRTNHHLPRYVASLPTFTYLRTPWSRVLLEKLASFRS
jgi:hypothetical protein